MSALTLDLWSLVRKRPQIDPSDLAEALRAEIVLDLQEYRARLLMRDSLNTLRRHWGEARYPSWLKSVPEGAMLEAVSSESFDEVGYPALPGRMMEKTEPKQIRQFPLGLGQSLRKDQRIDLAGSAALILTKLLARRIEDIDIVGDVPEEIRMHHRLRDELQTTYELSVSHVQTRYFPPADRNARLALELLGDWGYSY